MPAENSSSDCLSQQPWLALGESNICNPGFYCPNNTDHHPPVYCPPTAECRATRLQQYLNTCKDPQGTYEPIVCAPGFYCPVGGKEKYPCVKGHYCPLGTVEPIRCAVLSYCPGASRRELPLAGLLCSILVDLALVASYFNFATQRCRRLGDWARSCVRGLKPSLWRKLTYFRRLTGLRWGSGKRRCETGVESKGLEPDLAPDQVGVDLGFFSIAVALYPEREPIISGINGSIKKGTLAGILGPSGSGKTTLLNVLSGRRSPSSGVVTLDGVQLGLSTKYRYLIGFVPQDDITMPYLTVYENILHAARVRLGGLRSHKAISQRIAHLLDTLGLKHIQHSMVGSIEKRGISGGERKRLSIAVELVAAPMALLLDEPTSGLDSGTALSLMRSLKSITQMGITVISVVHQPREEIFHLFDSVLLLGSGRQLYMGGVDRVREHFQQSGYAIPSSGNIADALLDAISADCGPTAESSWTGARTADGAQDTESRDRENLEADKARLQALAEIIDQRKASWLQQAFLCLLRGLKQQRRQKRTFLIETFVGACCGLIIGLAVYKFKGHLFHGLFNAPFGLLSSAVDYTLVPQMGLLCSLAISLAAVPGGVQTYGDDKLVLQQEILSGHSMSAYFVGKELSTVPRIVLSSLHFSTFYAILATPMVAFRDLFLSIMLVFYALYGLAAAVSSVTRRENAFLMALLACLVVCIFNGYGPSLFYAKSWNLEWFWYICPGTWFAEYWLTKHTAPFSHLYNLKAVEDATGYVLDRTGMDLGILLAIGAVYRLLVYLGLAMSVSGEKGPKRGLLWKWLRFS